MSNTWMHSNGYHKEQIDVRYKGEIFPLVIVSVNGTPTILDQDQKELDAVSIEKLFDDKDFKVSFQYAIKLMENPTAKLAASMYLSMHVDNGNSNKP